MGRSSSPGGVTFTVERADLGRRVLLERVASLVAAAQGGQGILAEGTLGVGPLRLIPVGPSLAGALRSLDREFPGDLRAGGPGPAPSPSTRVRAERLGTLVHVGRSLPEPPPSPDRSETDGESLRPAAGRERFPVPLPSGAWLGVQSHWISRGDGQLFAPTRYRLCGPPESVEAMAAGAATALRSAVGPSSMVLWSHWTFGARARWKSGRLSRRERHWARPVGPADAVRRVEPLVVRSFPCPADLVGHLVVLGASGSGKTTFLARLAAERVSRGERVVLVDVHGDLAPAAVALVPAFARGRVVALDPSRGTARGPGIPILEGGEDDERAVAHVVAALKRLSADGTDLYWGFRLERVLDTFVRAAREVGGTLLDVYDLLTSADRRESARLATRQPSVARFLDELPAILRRNPAYLAPAAARLARVATSPQLTALLAPSPDALVPLSSLLAQGRSLFLRVPMGELGPEASAFCSSLVLTRIYLELARSAPAATVLLVLDEVHALSPRLVTEILAEGRKFGVSAVAATQYPERLAPELKAAASGAVGAHLVFRLAAPASRAAAAWAGLSPDEALETLPRLPDGWAVAGPNRVSTTPRRFRESPLPPLPADAAWTEAVERSRREFGVSPAPGGIGLASADEALLLGLYARASPMSADRLLRSTSLSSGESPAHLLERLAALERRGLIEQEVTGSVMLTAAGARTLGAGAEHGSSVESLEHRALLLEAFRLFAAHGERLSLLRQGRFDSRLPDARLALLPERVDRRTPEELRQAIERRRQSWAWRCFHGRDVHVEAEVSGADRPERIRRGLAKAESAGAFALFLVADPRRARRVRTLLERLGVGRDRAAVWTLPRARSVRGVDGAEPP